MAAKVIPINEVLQMIDLPELKLGEFKDEIEKEKRQGATHVIFNHDSDRTEISFQRTRID